MKKLLSAIAFAVAIVASTASVKADLLHDNGPLVTHPGAGFGGSDASALMTAFGGNIFGFGAQSNLNNRMADDFTVGGSGWVVNSARFYTYQTGSTTTSTITGMTLRILSGADPNTATVVWGDTTTNVMAGTGFTNWYRVLDTGLTANNRPIMFVDVNIGALNLGPGQYWMDFAFLGSLASGPWAPPVSDPTQLVTGNAMQSIGGGAYATVFQDAALTVTAALPFRIEGTTVGIPEPATVGLLSVIGLALVARRRRV